MCVVAPKSLFWYLPGFQENLYPFVIAGLDFFYAFYVIRARSDTTPQLRIKINFYFCDDTKTIIAITHFIRAERLFSIHPLLFYDIIVFDVKVLIKSWQLVKIHQPFHVNSPPTFLWKLPQFLQQWRKAGIKSRRHTLKTLCKFFLSLTDEPIICESVGVFSKIFHV